MEDVAAEEVGSDALSVELSLLARNSAVACASTIWSIIASCSGVKGERVSVSPEAMRGLIEKEMTEIKAVWLRAPNCSPS